MTPHITILALGSRGDVQPFIALAYHLQQAGYRVRMATNDDFAELIRSYGLDYVSLGSNVQEMVNTPEGQAMIHSGNFIASLRYFMTQTQKHMDTMQWTAYQACLGTDLLIYSGIVMSGASITEKLGIPSVPVFMIPAYPTRELPVPQGDLPDLPALNPIFYNIFIQVSWLIFRGAINRFRRERLGMQPAAWSFRPMLENPATPILLNFSEHVIPRPKDWPLHNHITGIWTLPPAPGWLPPNKLVQFLESGPAPIYIGFGSMADKDPEKKTRAIIEAIQRTEQRAILSKGWGGLRAEELPETIFMIDSVPHNWLFEYVSLVIHHGGAGTTAAGLQAGVPNIVVPHFGDQFFWGNIVHRLGVGPHPIPTKKLDAHRLTDAIQVCLGNPEIQKRAATLGEKLCAENGLANAQSIIERLL